MSESFQDANRRLNELLEQGYELVDVALILGEEFPRDLATKVLEEARKNGVL